MLQSDNDKSSPENLKKWVFVSSVRAHTHDVRALTMAVPISSEGLFMFLIPCALYLMRQKTCKKTRIKVKRIRYREKKPFDFSYGKWAHFGVPLLISADDDAKLFAYSAKDFTRFSPHDICPAPQRVPIQLVTSTRFNRTSFLLVQASCWLDVLTVQVPDVGSGPYGDTVTTNIVARVQSKACRKIICSAMSSSGELIGYCDLIRSSLFALSRQAGQSTWTIRKRQLPQKLPSAHSMILHLESSKLLHSFIPCREGHEKEGPPGGEPPITKMFTSSDDKWLAAISYFGDIYLFNLEVPRQHWFISRLDGTSVTAGDFPPQNNNVLIITKSSNQFFIFDAEARQLRQWSMQQTFTLPKRFQEFPGEVIVLSFSLPSSSHPSKSTSVVVYSASHILILAIMINITKLGDICAALVCAVLLSSQQWFTLYTLYWLPADLFRYVSSLHNQYATILLACYLKTDRLISHEILDRLFVFPKCF
ncbi:cirhin-like isoform 2 [Hibiscus syriacus]|uniref:Cirhin-like isoform 2 n=1 Tax=Hibiscus syriacus TaxID=106335 RepID=A0A6A2YN35_HIBSY|nr:cirhin-like isoform 2 [Hibiscus syriacus]